MGVAAADACEQSGLSIARLSDRTFRKLRKIFPGFLNVGNPVDLWGAANFDYYEASLRTVLEDDGVDIVIAILHLVPGILGGKNELETDRLGIIPELSKQFKDKTVVVEIAGDKDYYEAAKKYLEERSIPVFMPVEPGIEAVAYAYRCRQYMVRPE
jgi:acetyltransferase